MTKHLFGKVIIKKIMYINVHEQKLAKNIRIRNAKFKMVKKREVLHITKHQNKEIMKRNLFMCMCFTNVSRYENIILLKREKKVKRILDSVK